MKQFIIDISTAPLPNTQGNPTIIFYKKDSWKAACQLERSSNNAELDFGCYLRTLSNPERPALSVDSVEHAKALIAALELAISEKWFFTEKEINLYATSVTNTRADIAAKIKGNR